MNGIFYLVGLTLVGVFVLEALVHSPKPTIKKSGVPGLIRRYHGRMTRRGRGLAGAGNQQRAGDG